MPVPAVAVAANPTGWKEAGDIAYRAGAGAARATERVPLADADGRVLAEPLRAAADLPAFPTSTVDGWAVNGPGPWRIVGRVLAGHPAAPLPDPGTCVQIATGAMVPAGADAIVRLEDSTSDGVAVDGRPRDTQEWREPGDEARGGEELLPSGTPITPAILGFAAACGYDELPVYRRPRAAVVVFGDELLTQGPPDAGRVRDALGPSIPPWLRRLGAVTGRFTGPVADTLDAHVKALRDAVAAGVDLICTTGGTMHGPVDHLHPALAELGAEYLVNTVFVRPGFPMLIARLPGGPLVAGLPGNPQSAIVALASLVEPAVAGLSGRPFPARQRIILGADIAGRGDYTHLALVRQGDDGLAYPLGHAGSAMLRGLAQAVGFAAIPPGGAGKAGEPADLVPLPLQAGLR
jgi:molybdopterin molybdotransferase